MVAILPAIQRRTCDLKLAPGAGNSPSHLTIRCNTGQMEAAPCVPSGAAAPRQRPSEAHRVTLRSKAWSSSTSRASTTSLRWRSRRSSRFLHFYFYFPIIILPQANNKVLSDSDNSFYLKYLDVRVDMPTVVVRHAVIDSHDLSKITAFQEEVGVESASTPMACRLRNLSYSANLKVDIEYTRGNERVTKKDVVIGRIPIMLHSSRFLEWRHSHTTF